MEEITSINRDFKRGFNNGYFLAEYSPALSDKLCKSLKNTTDFAFAFKAGVNEYNLEIGKTKGAINEFKEIRNRTLNKDTNRDIEL